MANNIKELIENKTKVNDLTGFKQDYFLAIINGNVLNPAYSDSNPVPAPQKEDLLIYKDKIVATSSNFPEKLPANVEYVYVIDAEGFVITPGLIDQHIHGGYGVDFNYASTEEIIHLTQNLPKHGITSILATVMTAPEDIMKSQIEKIKAAKNHQSLNSTRLLGIHMEGPYLCTQFKGIQPEMDIRRPAVSSFKNIEDPEIKIVSFSPERDENFELTEYLSSKGIIPSAGHTSASAEVIREAAEYGLKQITHLFNAMSPLHHRTPGIIGEALVNDNLYVEVIADGIHLNPIIIEIIMRAKPDSRVIFISDSLPLNEASSNSMFFGGQEIFKKGNRAVNSEGTLAGSLNFLDSTIRNISRILDFSRFLKYTSLNIAQNLGRDDLGYIDVNKSADLVLWDVEENYQINTTIINGQIAFNKP